MNYQARLDRLAQPHLVGKQHTGGQARTHLMGNVKLVRDEVNPPADEAASRRLSTAVCHLQRPAPKGKDVGVIEMASSQTFLRAMKAYPVAQVGLGQFPPITAISQDTILLAHALDDPPFPLVIFHLLPCLELHALQWCALNRIHSHFAGGRVKKVHPPIGHLYYRTESKLGFG